MGRVFTYQTYLRIILTANVDVSGAVSTKIYYKKPSGVSGSVNAAIQNSATGILYYDLEPDSEGNDDFLDEVGNWSFWTYVEFSDGRTARGETVKKQIYDNADNC